MREHVHTPLIERLRPFGMSTKGFLGKNEVLNDILKADDELVKTLGLTHAQLADRIDSFMSENEGTTTIDGTPYNIRAVSYRGSQECPWLDDAKGSSDYTVTNLDTGEFLKFPSLISHLIREHQFYEGKQSPYRVDPEKIARVLGMKKDPAIANSGNDEIARVLSFRRVNDVLVVKADRSFTYAYAMKLAKGIAPEATAPLIAVGALRAISLKDTLYQCFQGGFALVRAADDKDFLWQFMEKPSLGALPYSSIQEIRDVKFNVLYKR